MAFCFSHVNTLVLVGIVPIIPVKMIIPILVTQLERGFSFSAVKFVRF